MTKRYLFVCGGTGKGLVNKRKLFKFDGFLQIDVTMETINVNDPLTNKMGLPLPGDTIVTTTDALYAQVDEIKQQVLRAKNHINRLERNHTALIQEYNRLVVELADKKTKFEEAAETKDDLSVSDPEREDARYTYEELREELVRLRELEDILNSDDIPYISKKQLVYEKEIQRSLFENVAREIAPVPIAAGMSQMPIIGSAYFNRQFVYEVLTERINGMTQGAYAPNAGEDIQIWIVSSMCGGTGQGISHHVANHVYKQLRANNPTSGIFVNFIRIGAWTYGNVGGQRIRTNAAMAVLHDAALAYRQLKRANNRQGVGAPYQFYYMEVPDVGDNSELRQQDIELAVRSIVNQRLQKEFTTEFTNIGDNDWFKALFVRTGYWARDIDKDTNYRETLDQLSGALDQFLSPNYIRIDAGLRHEFTRTQSLQTWMEAQLVELIPPRQVSSQNLITNRNISPTANQVETVGGFVESSQFLSDWEAFTKLLNMYIGLNDKGSFGGILGLGPNDPAAVISTVAFDTELSPKHSKEYIFEVRRSHEVVARVNHILAGGMIGGRSEVGRIAELYRIWNEMKCGTFEDQRKYTGRLQALIKEFLAIYVQTRSLLALRSKALYRINDARHWLDVLMKHVKEQQSKMPPSSTGVVLTRCTNFEQEVSGTGSTWLNNMRNVLTGNLADQHVVETFKSVVIWGSNGLTREGLRHILSLSPESTSTQIVNEINLRCGRYTVDGRNDVECPWWMGNTFPLPDNTRIDFWYRVFPNLPSDEYQSLKRECTLLNQSGIDTPEYFPTDDAYAGLRILAVECSRTKKKLMPYQGVSELFQQLLPSIQQRNNDANITGYIRRLASSSNGEAIFMNRDLANRISEDVDIRKHFVVVGRDIGGAS
jgi:hypothetical protein